MISKERADEVLAVTRRGGGAREVAKALGIAESTAAFYISECRIGHGYDIPHRKSGRKPKPRLNPAAIKGSDSNAAVKAQADDSVSGEITDPLLLERGRRYGSFDDNSALSQSLKEILRRHEGWQRLNATQRECLEMVCHKISRVMCGDPNYDDSWVDIGGYTARTVESIHKKEVRK